MNTLRVDYFEIVFYFNATTVRVDSSGEYSNWNLHHVRYGRVAVENFHWFFQTLYFAVFAHDRRSITSRIAYIANQIVAIWTLDFYTLKASSRVHTRIALAASMRL